MGKFIDQEIGLILGIAIGLWGGTGDFFVVHCVVSSVIVLFVGCWFVCCRSETGMHQVVRQVFVSF